MAFGTMRMSGGGGGSPTGYEPAYGGIPNLPQYVTDTSSMTGTDVQANLLKNLPGYMGMVGADVGNITQNLAGALSPDVIRQIQQQSAERGIATGAPGSANTNAEYLRALGLTSLQLQQLGHSQLTEAMQRTPVQQTQQTSQTRDLGAERAIYAAAPVPGAAARQAMLNAEMGMARGRGLAGGVPSYGAPGVTGGVGGSTPWTATPWSYGGTATGGGRIGTFTDTTPEDAFKRWKELSSSWPMAPSGATMGLPSTYAPEMYPSQQYGLPTWADTANTMGYNLPGNPPSPYQYYDESLADAGVDYWDLTEG